MERTPLNKGIRTGLQAIVGALIGLVVVVWGVPGVPEAVANYATSNLIPLLLGIGIPAGLVAWVQNHFGK